MPRDFTLTVRCRSFKRLPKELKAKMVDIWKMNPGAEDQAVADRLGISRGSVEKFRHQIGLKRKTGRKHDTLRLLADDGEQEYRHEYPQRVPESTLAERERRAAAADQRNYTQTFFGDPPVGFSALDQKRAGA